MPLASGARIGSYEVLGPIGAGGMGEVYRARDTRLNRDVAIKVLPDIFSGDSDRRARFEREAQLLAALNHSHIAQIYGVEEAAGIQALVMELVEGPTLADRIAAGPIPLDEALPIARQIAEALEAAHDKAVIHRDLKPANIKLNTDGNVKVLDFGLAKLIEPVGGTASASSPLSLSPTLSVQATYAGVLLGTAAYMSPEQARGRSVDRRTDVWAFGCVFYEMLTGTRPFEGEDLAETIGAVIHKAIDWSRLSANTPAAVRMTLERCLEKDPKRRIRDIGDVQLALSGAFETVAAAPAPPPRPRSGFRRAGFTAVALAIVATLAGVAVWLSMRSGAPRQVRFSILPTDGQPIAGTNTDRLLAISADGRQIVYVSSVGVVGGGLIVRSLDRFTAEPLPGIVQARAPFFSPDGQWIGFFTGANGELKKVSVTGGPAISLSKIQGTARGATWTGDGRIIFATNTATTGLLSVPEGGGEPKTLTTPDTTKGETDHTMPSVLPNGTAVLFTITGPQPQIAVLDLATGTRKILIRGGSHPEYLDTGHLVYAADGTLRAIRFDPDKLEIIGEAVPVVDRLAVVNAGAAEYAVSRTGTLIYIPGSFGVTVARNLVWVARDGREEAIGAEARPYTYPRLSPDQTRLAFNILDQQLDISVWDFRRRTTRRVTFDPATDFAPIWTTDGLTILFGSVRGGVPQVFKRLVDGTGEDERVTNGTGAQWPTAITRDGKTLVLHEEGGATGVDVRLLKLDTAPNGKRESEPLINSTFADEGGEISPDGRFIAYYSNRSTRDEVYVQPFPSGDGIWQVSTAGGTRPVWSRDGRELFYLDLTTAVMAVPVRTSPTFSQDNPRKLFDGPWYAGQSGRTYDVSSDGRRFLMIKEASAAQTGPVTGINVVLNWTEELKRRLPR